MQLTEATDLRTGRPPWEEPARDGVPDAAIPEEAEIAVVGAGIMGAMLAERLTAEGRGVVVLDRRAPARGATAASTALVMWAADMPLCQLAGRIGFGRASRMWRRVHDEVRALDARVRRLGLDCRWMPRPELYRTGTLLDGEGLAAEAAARTAAGLPSTPLAPDAVAERFGLPADAALLSADAFGADPVALTLGLLRAAAAGGARVCRGVEVVRVEQNADHVVLMLANARTLRARQLILATGYEPARLFLPPAFRLGASFAIASAPGMAPHWREHAMLWQASDAYLYARATHDGRIIVGGEDEDDAAPAARDALLQQKRGRLEAMAARWLGLDRFDADRAWAATFGRSPDGMPAIGQAANAERIWLAYGFGGNGISFAQLGSSLISAALRGEADPDAALFSPYRFVESRTPSSASVGARP